MSKPIWVSKNKQRLVGGTITEIYGADISGDVVMIALHDSDSIPPDTGWVEPSQDSSPTPSDRFVLTLIDNSTPHGRWFAWGDITDNPEIEPILLSGPHIVC